MAFAILSLLRSRVGRALAAIRDDEIVAAALGINVAWYKISIFVIAAGLSGMAGALYGSYLGGITPNRFGLGESIALLVVVAVGGLGSIPGTIVAAIVLTALPEFMRQYEVYRPTVYAAALILLIILFPGGLGQVLTWADRGVLAVCDRLGIKVRAASRARRST